MSYSGIEGEDFVVCRECGARMYALNSHLHRMHYITAKDYRDKFPGAQVWSKSSLKRKSKASIEAMKIDSGKGKKKVIVCPTCKKEHEVSAHLAYTMHDCRCSTCKAVQVDNSQMQENEDYVSCRVCGYASESLISHITSAHPHLIGRYKEEFPGALIVARTSATCAASTGKETLPVSSVKSVGRSLDLKLNDFTPFLESDGTVDRRSMSETLGVCQATLRSYMKGYGLKTSSKYVVRRIESPSRIVVSQPACAKAVSRLLGGIPYKEEWTSPSYVNPVTGWRFKFDAYYPDFELLLEFQGFQHWTFPSTYIKDRLQFEALIERDRQKELQVMKFGLHKLLLIREDAPWRSDVYLHERLAELGLYSK
jgi:hypothetical protein